MDGINTSGSAISAQRSQLDYRYSAGSEDSHPLRKNRHDGHHHGPSGHEDGRSRHAAPESGSAQDLSYYRSEKSVLKLRTQEGDIVSLRIRAGQSLSVKTENVGDSEVEGSETNLTAKSSTKLSLRIKGDLNADELVAIQSVLDQSAALADDFFSGDYAAAFAAASSLEVDGQQLAKVSLRMRIRESLTYSETGLPPVLFGQPAQPEALSDESGDPAQAETLARRVREPAAATQPATTTAEPEAIAAPSDQTATDAVSVIGESETPVAPVDGEDPVAVDPAAGEDPGSTAPTSQTGIWFSTVLDFVGRLIETFDTAAPKLEPAQPAEAAETGDSEQLGQVQLNISLKLRLFSAMLVEIGASEDASSAEASNAVPALVPEIIEAIATEKDAPFVDVA